MLRKVDWVYILVNMVFFFAGCAVIDIVFLCFELFHILMWPTGWVLANIAAHVLMICILIVAAVIVDEKVKVQSV